MRLNPVEWPIEGYHEFDETCRALVASAEAAHGAGWEAHVNECFRALVAALHQVARQQAQVEPDVRLVVGSTDPGERLERLEDESMRELNSSEVYWQWRAEIDEAVGQSRV